MDISLPGSAPDGMAAPAGLITESSTATFKADVLDESNTQPVLVDFWAPWCGPCRTLGPLIERIVTELAGKVKLVKINVDENQALAGQMGIQSIPAVFAFAGGRPVDGFLGAQPESQIRQFIDKVLAAAPPSSGAASEEDADIAAAMDAAAEAIAAGDAVGAADIYAAILRARPDHHAAVAGLAGVYVRMGEVAEARRILDMIPEEDRTGDYYEKTNAAIELAEQAESLGDAGELEARLEADADDHQARLDLAVLLNAQGARLEAAEQLVALMKRDRDWQDDAARRKLLEFFEAWGPKDPATLKGRRLLSSVLFS